MTLLSQADIAQRIPHRFENLLLDECSGSGNDTSEFSVTLSSDDAHDRDLFIYNHGNTPSIPTPLLTEISALACIVSAGEIKSGTFAYFAAIANFSIDNEPFQSDAKITGSTEKISDKNGFYKYRFKLSANDHSASGQLMAYYDTSGNSEVTLQPIELADDVHGALTTGVAVAPYSNKKESMTFVDTVHLTTDNEALYGYQYPSSHPLIKGHFPNNPVMMGVCQWQMLEDAMAHYFSKFTAFKQNEKTCNAMIFKSNLTPVCEIKSATIVGKVVDNQWHVYTKSIKKVLFKQRVVPNDQLYIFITAIV